MVGYNLLLTFGLYLDLPRNYRDLLNKRLIQQSQHVLVFQVKSENLKIDIFFCYAVVLQSDIFKTIFMTKNQYKRVREIEVNDSK